MIYDFLQVIIFTHLQQLERALGVSIPHISGGSHLAQTMKRVFLMSAANLRAYISGLPLNNVIHF